MYVLQTLSLLSSYSDPSSWAAQWSDYGKVEGNAARSSHQRSEPKELPIVIIVLICPRPPICNRHCDSICLLLPCSNTFEYGLSQENLPLFYN